MTPAVAVSTSPVGDYKDLQTLLDFADGLDVMTFDHEHVPTEMLDDEEDVEGGEEDEGDVADEAEPDEGE